MKKLFTAIPALLCCVGMMLLGGCSPKTKSFSIEDPQRIIITSLSGVKTEITDESVIRQVTDAMISIRFERGGASKDTNGFGPFISWYDSNDALMETVSVMGDGTILYDDHFWKAADGDAEMGTLYTILADHNAYS